MVELAECLVSRGRQLAVAESCTGGWIAKLITDLPGSSGWFDRGFVTYSNQAKVEMLGVSPALLDHYGAVSQPVVEAMAEGALARSSAHCALAVSGIAGPGGGSAEKPLGTVWLAWTLAGQGVESQCGHFSGDREQVRRQSVAAAIKGMMTRISS